MPPTTRRELTRGQTTVLITAGLPMLVIGGLGAWGTYTNIASEFHRSATAAGVVAAGEGLVLVMGLVMLGVTMLGQTAPAPVRIGLWLAPIAAAAVGVAIADGPRETAVYAITPLAMSGAAEGLTFVARRIVVYRDGVDMEVQRRNADAVQALAYQSALATGHPDEETREAARRKAWKLGAHVGLGDPALATDLLAVQRDRLRDGADLALRGMYAPPPAPPKPPAPDRHSAQRKLTAHFADMDPVDAVRIAHEAHPDMPPAELASLLVSYGVVVDAVQVALILGQRPPTYEVNRPDAVDAQQVSGLEAVTLEGAVVEAASILGPDARAREIAEHLAERRRLVVAEPYIRTALSRAAKRPAAGDGPTAEKPRMEGGYA
ncbi:conjugal transfer protein [Streptomyces sp. NPDC090026]|uniref:conjugal transfer protein n=1 Tax=Streptomyces sp. NPDC090026 TaxID=3365923 RepID=UPI00382755B5